MRSRGLKPYKKLGIIAAMTLGLNSYYQSHIFTFITPLVLIFVLSIAELFRRKPENSIFNISSTLFGVIYVGWLFSHLILLMNMPLTITPKEYYNILNIRIRLGTSFALLPFALTFINDASAFFIGRKLGKHKFFPWISPNKTIEGVIGGGIFSIIGCFIYRVFYATYLSWFDCLALGFLTAFFAPAGDLVESLIKRDANLKDSSNLIPGHGGFLDRFDSILFVSPIVYYYLRFFAAR